MKARWPSFFGNPISLVGGVIAVVSLGASTTLLFLDVFFESRNPYRGILTYGVFPSFLFLGILISFFGAWRQRRRGGQGFPILNLNLPGQRRAVILIVSFTMIFLLLSALGGYRAYEFTEETAFCGKMCHQVMQPEYTAYLNSPHARVKCVECHVGSGAEWYVRAKLTGLYQVYSTLAQKYPRPIPTPIEDLRPAQDTCEQCHWPEKFWGEQFKSKVHYSYDVANTRREVLMMIKTGGGSPTRGPSEGIHWHMNTRNRVEYLPRDEKRLDIPWFKVTYPDGTSKEYTDVEKPPTPEDLAARPIRRMDCMDCHNRPSHRLLSPDRIADELFVTGKMDPRVPHLKAETTAVLAVEYQSTAGAMQGLEDGLIASYRDKYPEAARAYHREIAAAVPEIQRIYRENFFPEMRASYAQYPDHISHKEFPGCFRCHNDRHRDAQGNALKDDCGLCHTFLARTPDGSSVVPIPPDPALFHPWQKTGRHGSLSCWECHTGKTTPYATCGQCHRVDANAPMAFACITCHQPQGGGALASPAGGAGAISNAANCSACHAVGGSKMHLSAGHKNCNDCHRPHEWKTRDPQDCSGSCHQDLPKPHYPDKKCSSCHDFRGVTGGYGTAPVPGAEEVGSRKVEGGSAEKDKKAGSVSPGEVTEPGAAREPGAAPPAPPVASRQPPAGGDQGAANCIAAGCHAALVEKPSVHQPVARNACRACHEEVKGEKHSFKLIAEEGELCSPCHVIPRDKKLSHKPFGQNACLSCHDPHSGATSALLAEPTEEELCARCHEKKTGAVVHAPVAAGQCSKCHLAHQSNEPALLNAKGGALCLSCHPAVGKEIQGAKLLHQPVEKGCGDCHKAHASPNPALLSFSYVKESSSGYQPENFELCFRCHARELIEEPKSTLTGFRNGDRNLHYVHVHREEKARTCSGCHQAHGSEDPRLVKKLSPFGKEGGSIPIGFEPAPNGGTCATGCHDKLSYDRGASSPAPTPPAAPGK